MLITNPYSIIPFATSIATASLGLFCFSKNHSSRTHRLFFLLCLSVVPWPFALGVFLNLHGSQAIIAWTKAGHLTCTLAPAVFFDFVVTLLSLPKLRFWTRLCYLYASVVAVAMLSTDYYFHATEIFRYSWGPYAKGNWFCTLDALFGYLVVVSTFVLLMRRLRQVHIQGTPAEYNRLRYLALAMGVFSFALLDYLPKYGVAVLPIGSFFLLGFAGIVTYAIIKHQILDFTIAIRRTAIYSILAALITASYLVVVLIMEKWFQGFFGYRSLVATSIVGFAIALGFNPLRNIVQRFVDRWFFAKSAVALAEENERLKQEVTQSERLKTVATLAAGMAHEIKNPLASIKTFAEYLPQKYDEPDYRAKFTKIITQEVDRMNSLIQRLLEFARPGEPQLSRIHASPLIQETLEFLQGTLLKKQIQVTTQLTQEDEVIADAGQMKQVLLNLFMNSVEAMQQAGTIRVATVRENGHLNLTVSDTGPGIAKKDLSRVFDPFYTTKANGGGLGLSVVHSIIREHGGRVTIHSDAGRGTTVRVQLPVKGGMNGTSTHSHRG